MIRFGTRLAFASMRAVPLQSALAALGGSLAVLLLTAALSIQPALERQEQRQLLRADPAGESRDGGSSSDDALLWAPTLNSETIGRGGKLFAVAVAADGPRAPRPLGADRAPAAGEVFVSPELARLLRRDATGNYRLRVPGRIVGTLDKEILASPDDLVMMVGWDAARLRSVRPYTLRELRAVPTQAAATLRGNASLEGRVLNIVLGIALLVPLLVFIRIAGRVADTRRRARLSALDLIGASPTQLRVIAAVEVATLSILSLCLAAVIGVVLRSVVPELRVAGTSFFVDDLRPPAWQLALLALLLPVLSYGAVRRGRPPSGAATRRAVNQVRHRLLRFTPALLGWMALVGVAIRSRASRSEDTILIGAGLTCVVLGLVLLVPVVLVGVAPIVSKVVTGARGLLAGAALQSYALSRARALTGVAAAVLVGSMAAVYFPSHDAWQNSSDGVVGEAFVRADAVVTAQGLPADESVVREISALPGIEVVLPVAFVVQGAKGPFTSAVIGDCPSLDRLVGGGIACTGAGDALAARSDLADGALQLTLAGGATFAGGSPRVEPRLARLFPTVDYFLPSAAVQGIVAPVHLVIDTDGSRRAAERLRGWLTARHGPNFYVGAASDDTSGSPSRNQRDYVKAQLVALFLVVVATASVALAQGTTILERRRELSFLVATGVPPATLRQAAFLEAAAPLLVLAVLAGGCGVAVAWSVLVTVGIPLRLAWSELGFMVLTVVGPVLLTIGLLTPLIRSTVAPTALRTE